MTLVRQRYTTVDSTNDWIVSVSYSGSTLKKAHWFEAQVSAVNEATGAVFPFPKELATYRVGEVEHPFRDIVRIDFAGDTDACVGHFLSTIYRRAYSYIEHGH